MVDLLLVRPPQRQVSPTIALPPLGLLYVAAAARDAGHSVAVLDAPAERLTWDDLLYRCDELAPTVIGVGGSAPIADQLAEACDRLRPVTGAVVLGGPAVQRHASDILDHHASIDALVVGEAEETIGPLLDWMDGGSQGEPPRGVHARGWPLVPRPRCLELDRLPVPARDLSPSRKYRYPIATRRHVATLMTSRGCSHRCIFCDHAVTGRSVRLHSARRIVDEIEEITRSLPSPYLVFFDDDFTVDADRVGVLCEGILSRGLDVEWKCESRVDGLDGPLVETMRRAGCRVIAMGVESSRPRSLTWLRKDVEVDRIREAFELCRRADIDTLAYVLIGIPGETPHDALATAAFCREIGARWVQYSTLAPYAGTPLFEEALREGWLVHSTVRNPADIEPLRATLVAPPWDLTTLGTTLLRCYVSTYLRPGAVLRELAATRGPQLPVRARAATTLARWMATEGAIGFARTSGLTELLFPER